MAIMLKDENIGKFIIQVVEHTLRKYIKAQVYPITREDIESRLIDFLYTEYKAEKFNQLGGLYLSARWKVLKYLRDGGRAKARVWKRGENEILTGRLAARLGEDPRTRQQRSDDGSCESDIEVIERVYRKTTYRNRRPTENKALKNIMREIRRKQA